ncbi:MAG: hypothetical protein AB8V79_03085 [Candidatus Midichloria sp.]
MIKLKNVEKEIDTGWFAYVESAVAIKFMYSSLCREEESDSEVLQVLSSDFLWGSINTALEN